MNEYFRKAVNFIIYKEQAKDDNDVAQKIGQGRSNFSKYKNGKLPVPVKVIKKFEDVFKVDIEKIDIDQKNIPSDIQEALKNMSRAALIAAENQRESNKAYLETIRLISISSAETGLILEPSQVSNKDTFRPVDEEIKPLSGKSEFHSENPKKRKKKDKSLSEDS